MTDDNFVIGLGKESSVMIGDRPEKANKVFVEVTNQGADAEVRITLSVEWGATETALLAAIDTPINIQASVGESSISIGPRPQDLANTLSWRTRSAGDKLANSKLILSLTDFESKTRPGKANITIKIEVKDKNRWTEPVENRNPLAVEKKINPEAESKPTIHYFTVNPDYILHAGETGIKGSFYATGFDEKNIKLLRNNQPVDWKSQKAEGAPTNKERGFHGCFEDKPSITSVYRLDGRDDSEPVDPGGPRLRLADTRQQTVHVITPGWNRVALPQGYPTNMFVANDFETGEGPRLYGIFSSQGSAGLYGSATGVDGWKPVKEADDKFPQNMASSPGVAFDNKLWLVGGSTVDVKKTSGEVYCYEQESDQNQDRLWCEKPAFKFPTEMSARMGHACVVLNDRILVLGGYDGDRPLNDVWKFDGNTWNRLVDDARWPPRCIFAAVVQKTSPKRQILWIYGGGATPTATKRYRDLWSTEDGKNWTEHTMEGFSLPIVPEPGDPLGAALLAYPESDRDRFYLMGSFIEPMIHLVDEVDEEKRGRVAGNRVSSFMFEWHPDHEIWETTPVIRTWEQFGGDSYYMQSVAFNRFIYVWSLNADIPAKRLNVFIPG